MNIKKTNDQKISEVLKQMVNSSRLKPKLTQTKIQESWSRLMGPSISRYTKKIGLRKKKLYITIDSAALKNELMYAREKIKKMLNEELGEEYIEEVIIY